MLHDQTGTMQLYDALAGPTLGMTGRSWEPNRCYGVRALLLNYTKERDCSMFSSLIFDTGALMEQFRHRIEMAKGSKHYCQLT